MSFYDRIADVYDARYSFTVEETATRMARVIAALALPPADAFVLSLGIGTGREVRALEAAGARVWGVDDSRPMLGTQQIAAKGDASGVVLQDMFAPFPFVPHAFNGAVCLHGTLNHAPSPQDVRALAAELHRVACDGARFVAEVPTLEWLDVLDHAVGDELVKVTRDGARGYVLTHIPSGETARGTVYTPAEWAEMFAPHFAMTEQPISTFETMLVARRL